MTRIDIERVRCGLIVSAVTVMMAAAAGAEPLAYQAHVGTPVPDVLGSERAAAPDSATRTPSHLRRRIVSYTGQEPVGTIIIDTANTYLYLVSAGGTAIRYGIGVGREGFAWAGVKLIDHKAEWPDWTPPPEMIARQPYLPRFMAGGPGNPLGARAIYLGGTLYRIHGTNVPSSIGTRVSSGCIRMLDDDVIDLYARVSVGSRVVVLPSAPDAAAGRNAILRPDAGPGGIGGARAVVGIY